MEKNFEKQIKHSLKLKVTKKKDYKLYSNWKSYDNSINTWIDKKDIVQVLYKISEYFPKTLNIVVEM